MIYIPECAYEETNIKPISIIEMKEKGILEKIFNAATKDYIVIFNDIEEIFKNKDNLKGFIEIEIVENDDYKIYSIDLSNKEVANIFIKYLQENNNTKKITSKLKENKNFL